jgi:type II secretory pathway component GspD/PulD (secretin)
MATMEEYLRGLSVFCPVILLMGGVLEAQPKAEVIIGVIVMQVNSERAEHLAATMTSAGAAGLLSAFLTDKNTEVVSQSQLRVSDGHKVQLQIGDCIPYATCSFLPGVGTVGGSPLISMQSRFADAGVAVDVTPQVHNPEEVTVHVEITVSAVTRYISLGGFSQPVIGQNKNIADLRLREGEVNILGGLGESQDSTTLNGIPGLVNIPALGKTTLFGASRTERDRQGLIIALIPHIVRTPAIAP